MRTVYLQAGAGSSAGQQWLGLLIRMFGEEFRKRVFATQILRGDESLDFDGPVLEELNFPAFAGDDHGHHDGIVAGMAQGIGDPFLL